MKDINQIESRDKGSCEIIQAKGLYKKFCKNLKYNMFYGIQDLLTAFIGLSTDRSSLRNKEFWALQDLSISIMDNEITALLGVNGSGKTTLIRILSGIYELDNGSVIYSDSIRKVASVFAIKSGLHPTLSGRENIYLKSAFYGRSRKEVDSKLDFILEFSGVSSHIDAPLGTYSSGMKTRLAMSIALSVDADVLFIDEGFSFSDPGFKQRCFDYLAEKYKQKNKALIFATHQIGKISDLADRIILLNKGEVVKSTYDIDEGLSLYLEYCK